MKIRFAVNQAAAFRKGLDIPRSINELDVDPKSLPQWCRDLIADRLDGICLGSLGNSGDLKKSWTFDEGSRIVLLETADPSLRGLIEAVINDQIEAKKAHDEKCQNPSECTHVSLKRLLPKEREVKTFLDSLGGFSVEAA